MKFTDYDFIWFFAIVYSLWWLLRKNYVATLWLLLGASVYFYGHHGEERIPLILSFCVVNWWVGRTIPKSARPGRALAMGVAFNLMVLCFFKYTPMLTHSAAWAMQHVGGDWKVPKHWFEEWEVPFGLSFYAFTGIAYMVDVFRKDCREENDLPRYSLYLTFFPQLMAGPILRPHDFLDQLQSGEMPDRPRDALEGAYLFGRGMFKKMVLADRIGLLIDPYFQNVGDVTTAGAWSLPYIYLYAFQILFDFSGYTDIARGLGLLFGFRWPRNFNGPYFALSIQDFWRRWHMTLSSFLRDYFVHPAWWQPQAEPVDVHAYHPSCRSDRRHVAGS